jgi:hypothetical protein
MEATTQPLITDLHQFSTDMLASEINPSQAAAQQATDDGDNVQANCNSLSYQHPES